MSKLHPKARVFGYVRASTLEQVASPEKQRELVLERATQLWPTDPRTGKALEVFFYCDEGRSATKTRWYDRKRRPELAKLLDAIEREDHMFVWRLDRLERSMHEGINCVRFLLDRGVNLHILDMGGLCFDLDTVMGGIFLAIYAGMAQLFSEQLSETIKAEYKYRRAHGLAMGVSGGPAKRRVAMKGPPPPGRKNGCGKLDIWDDKQCALIQEIFLRYSSGEAMIAIAEDFYRRQERNKEGRLWCAQAVENGYHVYRTYSLYSAFWWHVKRLAKGSDLWDKPATPEQEQEAKDLLAARRRGPAKRPGMDNLNRYRRMFQ